MSACQSAAHWLSAPAIKWMKPPRRWLRTYLGNPMGFLISTSTSVGIDRETEELLKKLRTNPASVFEKPYGGYLLFLVSGVEKEILDWITKNVVLLDSVTGEDIAFALFVRNFTLKLKVRQGTRNKPPLREHLRRRKQIDIPLEEVKTASSISKLVKSGRCGWVLNNDEINAITYAVDDLARGFGVMRELPCIIVLDAIPRNSFEVFPLNHDNVQELIPVLRGAIDCLRELPNYQRFMRTINDVFHYQNELTQIHDKIETLLQHRSLIEQIPERIREALFAANPRLINSVADNDWPDFLMPRIKEYVNEAYSMEKSNHELLDRLAHTRFRLDSYENKHSWPLEEPARSRFENVYRQYVCRLLESTPESLDLESPKQCRALNEQLHAVQTRLIDSLIASLPPAQPIFSSMRTGLLEDSKEIDAALDNAVLELRRIEKPSLIKCFKRETRKRSLSSTKSEVRDSIIEFVVSWLKPETLLDVWKQTSN